MIRIRATALLSLSFFLTVVADARAGDVTTIAGVGIGFSGDGGPALTADLSDPFGLAVAPDGTIYFADNGNFRIRKIDPAGIISTIVGTGSFGDTGNGGPATSATIAGVVSVALDPTGTLLYFADVDNNWVRQVDLVTGIISIYAGMGTFGFGSDGDGGPATSATFMFPTDVAVDSAGNVYITDAFSHRIRRVDAVTGIISTFAGGAGSSPAGDGGLATLAALGTTGALAIDGDDNVFLLDHGGPPVQQRTVRVIEATTGIITTVAGGGSTIPGFGTATTMQLGSVTDIAVDDAGQLFIPSLSSHRVYKVDLASGVLSVYAGTGAAGDSGDGGPALDATFAYLSGAAVTSTGELLVCDQHKKIRSIESDVVIPFDILITLITSQAFLDLIQSVDGSVVMINVDGHEFLIIPNMTSVGLDVTLVDSDELLIIDLGALESVGGDVEITGNLALTTLDLSSLTTVDGSLTITDNSALTAVLVSGVTSVGGDLTIIGTAATVIDLSALTSVVGGIDISGNSSAGSIDLGSLTSAGGYIDVSGNTSAGTIDLSALTSASGYIDVSGNTSAGTIDLSELTSAGGYIDVSGNTSAGTIDLSELTSAGGYIDVSGNTSAGTIDLSALTSAGGYIDVSGNTSAGTIDLSALTSASGYIDVSGNTSAGTIDLSELTSAGGYIDVSGNTSAGTIDLSALTSAGGDVDVTDNTSAGTIDLGALTSADGDVDVTDNTSATGIDLSSLESTGGGVDVSGNGSATGIDLSSLTTTGGGVDVSGNGSATGIDLSSLTTTGGGVDVSGNGSATGIDLSSLTTAGGGVDVSGNGSATGVDLSSLTSVDGNLTVETSGSGSFDVTGAAVAGDTSLATDGYTTVAGTTAAGSTAVSMGSAETIMSADIGPATFVTPVDFAITQIAPEALPPEMGTVAGAGAATVDPVAAYEFTFGVPTLDQDASLSFDVLLAGLPPATSAAVLAALDAGKLTMATKGNAPGSTWQSFPVCTGVDVPTAGGCVQVQTLDASGEPTTGTPDVLRFSNVVGHFSAWSVAIVATEAWTDLGGGIAGGAGIPSLVGSGPLTAGSVGSVQISSAEPFSNGVLFVSGESVPTPFQCGTLIVSPTSRKARFVTDADGNASPLVWSDWSIPSGETVYFQAYVVDSSAPCFVSLSNALIAQVP